MKFSGKSIDLTISDTLILKGFFILLIVFHNWCHLNSEIVCTSENEMNFSIANTLAFWNCMFSLKHVFYNLFSFWGWLGVPIFCFLTGYGLEKKYELFSNPSNFTIFWQSIKKLYFLLIPIAILSIFQYFGKIQADITFLWNYISLLSLSETVFEKWPIYGPWWYIDLTAQFYLLFFLLKSISCRLEKKVSFLIILSCVSFLVISIFINNFRLISYLRFNFIGWCLPFFMGMFLAKGKKFPCSICFCFFYLFLFIISDFHKLLWAFQPLFFVCFVLSLYVNFRPRSFGMLLIIGKLSPMIFVIHPLVRYSVFGKFNYIIGPFIYISITLFLSYIYYRVRQLLR